jgi:hypothetical protein
LAEQPAGCALEKDGRMSHRNAPWERFRRRHPSLAQCWSAHAMHLETGALVRTEMPTHFTQCVNVHAFDDCRPTPIPLAVGGVCGGHVAAREHFRGGRPFPTSA